MTVAQGTPRTDAVFEAMNKLPWGSMVEVPAGHPPCDPWELARELERENAALSAQVVELQKDAERYRYVRAKPAMLLHLKNSEFDAAIDEKAGL